jgi:uncharacterized protein YjbI with pentapeptide repeats
MPSTITVVLVVSLVFAALYFIPKLQIHRIRTQGEPKGPLELENDYRQTLVQIFGGVAILLTVGAAIWNANLAQQSLDLAHRSFELSRENQVSDRTFKALEMLAKQDNMDSRLAGIYALGAVAREEPKYEWQITETLFNYLQVHSGWPPVSAKKARFLSRDVSAVGDFLIRRPSSVLDVGGNCLEPQQCWDYEKDGGPSESDISNYYARIINLPYLDLRGVFLESASLKTANINYSHLEHSWLRHSHFENAFAQKTHLEYSDLSDSHWQFANLYGASMNNAQLCRAHFEHVYAEDANLENADLRNSSWNSTVKNGWSNKSKSRVTNLKNANLACSNWSGADMQGLFMEGAKLFGADLRNTNITKEQLQGTHGDRSTKLSDESLRPSNWDRKSRTACLKASQVPFCPDTN